MGEERSKGREGKIKAERKSKMVTEGTMQHTSLLQST